MNSFDLVNLTKLMEITSGRSEVVVGLLDGPVAVKHPDLVSENIREISSGLSCDNEQTSSVACMHGTFVAGILCGRRNSPAPAICPNCTLLVRPIFVESSSESLQMPSTTPDELASAIIECIEAGANVLNLSVALEQPSMRGQHKLEEALNYAAGQKVITVVAAGNQGMLGSSAITRHPWVIPVVAYDVKGRPMNMSNLGGTIGRHGLGAPGDEVNSLGVNGKPISLGGTSAATPFVTGAIALLWSAFPTATATTVKFAVTQAYRPRRTTVIPPLLDAWGAYQALMGDSRP
jgi:subtilisin family serine protease